MLLAQDFLTGGWGAYSLTPEGEEFGATRFCDNGHGGSAYRGWPKTHFDPSIMDALDTSPGQIAKAAAEVRARKEQLAASAKVATEESEQNFRDFMANKTAVELQHQIDWKRVGLVAGGAAVAVGVGFGVYYGAKVVKRDERTSRRRAHSDSSDPA